MLYCHSSPDPFNTTLVLRERHRTEQSTKVAASSAVTIVSKHPQFETQTVDFLRGICFLITLIANVEAKGLTGFGYLTSVF